MFFLFAILVASIDINITAPDCGLDYYDESGDEDEIQSLIIQCTDTSFICQTSENITVANLTTNNCAEIQINNSIFSIQNFTHSNPNSTYIRPLIQQLLIMKIFSQQIQIPYFNAPNFTLIAQAPSIQIGQFQGYQLFIFSNYSVSLFNSAIIAYMLTCTNNYGFEVLDYKSKSRAEQIIRNIDQGIEINLVDEEKVDEIISILIASNFTIFIYSEQNLDLQNSSIRAAQIGMASNNLFIDQESQINSTGFGCQLNQGNGRGPAFIATQIACIGNGGSNGGYGGVGLANMTNTTNTTNTTNQSKFFANNQDVLSSSLEPENNNTENNYCLQLTNSTRFMFNLYPYGFQDDFISQGSGGGILQQSTPQFQGSGGGAIILTIRETLTIYGQIIANGLNNTNANTTKISGAGAGGSITLRYSKLIGSNNSLIQANGGNSTSLYAGEGGGGMIKIRQNLNITYNITPFQGYFNGTVQVLKGNRTNESLLTQSFLGQGGVIFQLWCPPYQESTNQSGCQLCPSNYYKLWWGGQCVKCPSDFTESDARQQLKTPIQKSSSFCPDLGRCKTKNCSCSQSLTRLFQSTSIQISVFIVFILIGYFIRRSYKRSDQITEKNFDFENQTKEIVNDKIITESLQENNSFALGDLMYHAYRINVIGNNTYNSPWVLHTEPPQEIANAVLTEEYSKFAQKFNKLSSWSYSVHIALQFLAVISYPLYWVCQTKLKKKKYNLIYEYMSRQEIYKFWRGTQQDQSIMRLKLTKSADYTLLYIDIFNYKNCDMKYIYLTCPFIICMSGEGNFLRPYYLCESDQFLISLFFAINKKPNISLNRFDGNRFEIMKNLVDVEKREENSKEIRRFLRKINKVSMTLDYGAPAGQFVRNFKDLFKMLSKWNQKFFSQYQVKLELIIMQIPFDTSYNSQIITIIEMKEDEKFKAFIKEIHHNVNYHKLQDVKYGFFILNTELDPEEIHEALYTQKFSFYEQQEDITIQDQEQQIQELDQDINNLREQFLQKTYSKDSQIQSHVQHQFKQMSEKKNHRQNSFDKLWNMVKRFFEYIRYQAFSHKTSIFDKYTLIIGMGVLILVDNFLLQLIITVLVDITGNFTKLDGQLILLPYPFTIMIANILGSIWIPSQSYGLLKVYMIFNTMAITQYVFNFIGNSIASAADQAGNCMFVLDFSEIIVKIGIQQLGQRLIPMNIKLNQLSNKKK